MSNNDPVTVGDILRHHAERRPMHTAMVFADRKVDYGRLNRLANQVANGFTHQCRDSHSRVAYLGKNSDRYYEIFFGAAKSATVLVAINWRLACVEVEYIINDSGVELLFVESGFTDVADHCLQRCSGLKKIIYIDRTDRDGYVAWRDHMPATDPHLDNDPNANCLQMYTSGTTGKPKGVLLPHRCFSSQRMAEQQAGEWGQWRPEDINLVAMPTFHIGGTGWGLVGFYNGSTNIIHPAPDAEQIALDIEKHAISKMFVVPAVLQMIVEYGKFRQLDFSSVAHVVYGASPIPQELLKESVALFGCGFVQQYGMTEACGAVTYLPPEDHLVGGSSRMKSCGKAMPGVEIKICDKLGNRLAAGESGEILIKSPAMMSSYWNLPEATAETFVDGWYKSGDAGYLDSDGYLYMQDRVKDMIISGGENIYPAEVESVLYRHPAIADVAVIGAPDKKWGEAVKALVVAKPHYQIDQAEVISFARHQIADYKLPKSVDVVTELPRNASGKILKTQLREKYWQGCDRHIN